MQPPSAVERAAALPCWKGSVVPVPLEGGLTNRNFVVVEGGERFVVRIGDDIPAHHVDRRAEARCAHAAAAAGVGPELVHAEGGALVMRHIDGRSLTGTDVREPGMLRRVATLLRRAHDELAPALEGPAPLFWVFHVIRDYGRTLQRDGSAFAVEVPGWLDDARRLEAIFGPVDLVLAHNDLLPANLIDDGHRLWLVDWEYAGFNDPLFDLGGLAANCDLDTDAEHELLAVHDGRAPDARRWRRYRAMKAAAMLREAMWGMVSQLHLDLPIDYAAYARSNLERYARALAEAR